MKGIVTKVIALMLLVWYSMSVIGFGVHTCSGTGESFVVTFVEGFECEDIHPEHHCAKGICCSHHHSCSESHDHIKAKSCCSSDYQVLALTGTVSDEKNIIDDQYSFIYNNYISASIIELDTDQYALQLVSRCTDLDHYSGTMSDIQSILSVWRI